MVLAMKKHPTNYFSLQNEIFICVTAIFLFKYCTLECFSTKLKSVKQNYYTGPTFFESAERS